MMRGTQTAGMNPAYLVTPRYFRSSLPWSSSPRSRGPLARGEVGGGTGVGMRPGRGEDVAGETGVPPSPLPQSAGWSGSAEATQTAGMNAGVLVTEPNFVAARPAPS